MKKSLTILILVILTTLSVGTATFAAENQFTVSQSVTGSSNPDTTAPSIPTSLTATAVSTSQINLSWTASTDDTAVTGYHVYRNSVLVGTSSGTTYSDAGLSANTSYSYTVSAFDAVPNESAQSSAATATTLRSYNGGNPSHGSNQQTNQNQQNVSVGNVLTYLNVFPDLTSAVIKFGTPSPMQATVHWGKTLDYELGSVASYLYTADNSILITDLEPGTHYYFKIDLMDANTQTYFVEGQEFTTASPPDIVAPQNVSGLQAKPSHADIALTWKNPKTDFDRVRIVRSDKFYPRDPTEGEIIFEGRAEMYIDKNVVTQKNYYYTLFSIDAAGNYSSGAVDNARLLNANEEFSPSNPFADIVSLSQGLIDPLLKNFNLNDITFIQNGKKLPVVSNSVEVQADRNLTVSIDYEKVPEILKTIVMTLHDPDDASKTFSFLLRVNADKTAYESEITAFERPGAYNFDLHILDYKHQGLVSVSGTIVSKMPEIGHGGALFDGSGLTNLFYTLTTFLTLLAAVLIGLLVKGKAISIHPHGSASFYKKP